MVSWHTIGGVGFCVAIGFLDVLTLMISFVYIFLIIHEKQTTSFYVSERNFIFLCNFLAGLFYLLNITIQYTYDALYWVYNFFHWIAALATFAHFSKHIFAFLELFNYYKYGVFPFLIWAGIGSTVIIGLGGWDSQGQEEYGYWYNAYIFTSRVFESFIVLCFLILSWRVNVRLNKQINNPFYDNVVTKRKHLWICVISYLIYNILYLMTDAVYVVYRPNKLWIGYFHDGLSAANVTIWIILVFLRHIVWFSMLTYVFWIEREKPDDDYESLSTWSNNVSHQQLDSRRPSLSNNSP